MSALYEALAFAGWAGERLPSEFEWEIAAADVPRRRQDARRRPLAAPTATARTAGVKQMFGDVWEWTASAYLPYPGFRPRPAPLASTTASSCGISSCCAAAPAPRRRPYSPHLPQLLLSLSALAVHGLAPGGRRLMERTSITSLPRSRAPAPAGRRGAARAVRRGRAAGWRAGPAAFPAASSTTRGARRCSRRSPRSRNIIRRGWRRRCSTIWRGDRAPRWEMPRVLVEFGSGSSRKTSLLLAALDRCGRLHPDRRIGGDPW